MRKFLKTYNEWISLPLAVLLFILAPQIYRLYDPTAGAFDLGYFHSLIFAVIGLNIASGISWLMFKMNFPHLYRFWDDGLEALLMERHSEWEHRKHAALYSMVIYLAYFLAIILLIIAVI